MSDGPAYLTQEQLDAGQQVIQESVLDRVLKSIIDDIYTLRALVIGTSESPANSAGGLVGSYTATQSQVTGIVAATGDMRLSYNALGSGWIKCVGYVCRCDEFPELLWVLQNAGFVPQAEYVGLPLFRVPNVQECPPTASPWRVSYTHVVGNVVSPYPLNGYVYACTVAGTTAATQPTWPTTIGATVADNTVTWITRKAPDWYIRT